MNASHSAEPSTISRPLKYVAPMRGEKVDGVPEDAEFLGLEQFESWTGRLVATESEQHPEGGANAFLPGDVLFGKLRPYLAKAWVADRNGYCTTEALVLKPRDVEARFLRYYLLTPLVISAIDASTYGSKMPRADWSFIGALKLTLPPRREQERIANFLDQKTARIDALIAEKERLRLVLKLSLESAIERATLPTNNAPAQIALKRLARTIVTGPFGSALHSSDYVEGGVPVVNPSHIVGDEILPDEAVSVPSEMADALSSYRLAEGDLVVGRRGELGRCAVVSSEGAGWLCGTGCLRLTIDRRRLLPAYAQLVISSAASREWLSLESVGSTMENLNAEILGRLPGYFPSIQIQRERLFAVNRAKEAHAVLTQHVIVHIERLVEYRASLITAAVTGQLRIESAGVRA